ncbi:MAG: 16S rRNA (adenine(1518)-N(6)/adenine(1519)-N(6))-dimethyltransferase RsmA [Rhodospirillales bacterium]|nr:16S rRNA (adenine(1518)-N(6)/adenine(1519)-N(6))-dimethyltransferase RsmA [Rhodospirillales bacterium]
MTSSLPPLRDIIAKYDLGAKKSLGQNFLLDLNLTGRIARTGGDLTKGTVIEIGPGPGGLTRALLDNGTKRLIVIERDKRCLDALAEIDAAYPGCMEVIEGDALKVDVANLGDGPRKVVANLPYNISTVLLLKWIKDIQNFEKLTLMFQKEVADRICAEPGSKSYGRLSIFPQWLCHVRQVFNVDRKAFTPPPKIMSTIVSFTPREKPLAPANAVILEKVVTAAFGKRRKMLRQSLKSATNEPEKILEMADVLPTARAETLTVEQFCALARAYEELLSPLQP